MGNRQNISLFSEIISALLILLFVYTGISKLSDYEKFEAVLGGLPIIGRFAWLIAIILPVTELSVATLLFIPRCKRKGLLLSFLLMSMFTFYLGFMILFVNKLPCSCGGVLSTLNWQQHLVFNIGFTLLALSGWWLINKRNNFFIAINRGSRKPV